MKSKPKREKAEGHKAASHYVDNREFLKALQEYHQELKTNPNARVSEFIGECILKICSGVSKKYQFNNEINHRYINDMVGDAVLVCLRAVPKFDSSMNTSAFSYFTTCAERAFLHRIEGETNQVMIQYKVIVDYFDEMGEIPDGFSEDDAAIRSEGIDTDQVENMRQKILQKELAHMQKIKKVKPLTPLEELDSIDDLEGLEDFV